MLSYIQNNEKYSLFIDGSNLHAASKCLGFEIDYKKLLSTFSAFGQLVRAYYYTALIDDQEYSPIRPLVDWLDYNGFSVITKPAKEFSDEFGNRKIKGDMDIEIAVDILEFTDQLDHIILFSGDGDFRRMVEAVQRRSTRVTVVSTVKSQPPMAADELRRQADFFIDLNDVACLIARRQADNEPFAQAVRDGECGDTFKGQDAV